MISVSDSANLLIELFLFESQLLYWNIFVGSFVFMVSFSSRSWRDLLFTPWKIISKHFFFWIADVNFKYVYFQPS